MLSRAAQAGLMLSGLCVGFIIFLFLPPPEPPPITFEPHRITRGPLSVSDAQHEAWLASLKNLPPENGTAAWILQSASSAISVNAEIPVWGVFLGVLTGVGAFFALRAQMTAHVKNDEQQFKDIKDTLKEIRRDVRSLGGTHHFREDEE